MAVATRHELRRYLRVRVARAASEAGHFPHRFMLEAKERWVRLAGQRREFARHVLDAEREATEHWLIQEGSEDLTYLQARLEGREPIRPPKRPL